MESGNVFQEGAQKKIILFHCTVMYSQGGRLVTS